MIKIPIQFNLLLITRGLFMFIGHYAVSLALKSKSNNVSLGLFFIAVQFIDILFFPLTLMGIEKFNIIENYTESTHFQLEFMPYSHSLFAVFIWAILFFILYKIKFIKSINKHNVFLLAIAVLSHWFLDLLVHTPDLPILTNDSQKLGFGLWNNAILTYLLEAIILIAGLVIYMRNSLGKSKLAKYGMPIFIAILLLLNIVNIFGPLSPEDTNESVAISAIFAYFIFAAIAHWLDKSHHKL